MTSREKERFYQLIIEELQKVLKDSGEYKKELADLGNLSVTGLSDRAALDDIKISLMQMETSRSEKLRDIYGALDKLDRDTYGMCEHCGKPIKESRLEFLPFAQYCIECQAELEQSNQFGHQSKRGYTSKKMKVTPEEWGQWIEADEE